LIRPEWQRFIRPGLVSYSENAARFQPRDAQRNRQALVALLRDDNPFLTVAALRTLANAGALDAKSIAELLLREDPFWQGVATCVLLNAEAPEKRGEVLREILKVVDQAENYSRVRGITSGLLVVCTDVPRTSARRDLLPLIYALIEKARDPKMGADDGHALEPLATIFVRWQKDADGEGR
jgi:hypothetical protein